MNEISLLKEIGLSTHLDLVGYALVISFIVKVLYQDHMQRFLSDVFTFISKISKNKNSTKTPSLYEMLPKGGQRIFDYIEITWSYLVAIFCILFVAALIIMAADLKLFLLPMPNILLYSGLVFVLISTAFISTKNGNKVLYGYINQKKI